MQHVLAGALQVIGRPLLATRVGAFNFGEIGRQFRMAVLKQQFCFDVAAPGGGFVLFPFGNGSHATIVSGFARRRRDPAHASE